MCVVVRLQVERCGIGNRKWAVINLSLKRKKLNRIKWVMSVNINLLFMIKKEMFFRTPKSWIQNKATKKHENVYNDFPITSVWLSFLCFIYLFVRWRVLELSLWLVMLGLTACLTSWSTSLSTTDSASTSSVLVSVSFVICLFWLDFYCRKSCFFRYPHKTQIVLAAFSFSNQTIQPSVQLGVGSITNQVIVSVSSSYFVLAYYSCARIYYHSDKDTVSLSCIVI